MAGALALVLIAVSLSLPAFMGKAKASGSARELFGKSRAINLLAAARVMLFGARDVWFVVGLPVFLYASGWTFTMVGGFLAVWTIGYGAVQAFAPHLVPRFRRRAQPRGRCRADLGNGARGIARHDRAGADRPRTCDPT